MGHNKSHCFLSFNKNYGRKSLAQKTLPSTSEVITADLNSISNAITIMPLVGPGPEVIKLFSCSTQQSMRFKLLLNIDIAHI